MIDPKDLKRELGVEGLCRSAEEYFLAAPDPEPLMAKPFHSLEHSPQALQKLGLLLAGLKLAKSMAVLDFGAGTCWLSRILSQLGCRAISLDPSSAALALGRRLFREHPVIGPLMFEPSFLQFNGRRIELGDESVDRIVCFDSFHHVPNREEVLAEFFRVLKPGGMVGFCEPGRGHWQSAQSQHEMAEFNVLEEDVVPDELFLPAREAGFTGFSCKLLCNPHIDLSRHEYKRFRRGPFFPSPRGLLKAVRGVLGPLRREAVFFFQKGEYVLDSRSSIGLSHQMKVSRDTYKISADAPLEISVKVANTGDARWLCSNDVDVGVVKLGAHLYESQGRLLDWDFRRNPLTADAPPGAVLEAGVRASFASPGEYRLVLDLVSENVCWFEQEGSRPQQVKVIVS